MISKEHPHNLRDLCRNFSQDELPEIRMQFKNEQAGIRSLRNWLGGNCVIDSNLALQPRHGKPYCLRDYFIERGYIARGRRNDLMFSDKGAELLREVLVRGITESVSKAAQHIAEIDSGYVEPEPFNELRYLREKVKDLELQIERERKEKDQLLRILESQHMANP